MRSLTKKSAFRNFPLIVTTVTVLLSLEGFGWSYLAQTNDTLHAVLMAVVVSGTGLVGLIAAFVAAERRQDPRKEIRDTAGWAHTLAVVMMFPGMWLASDAIAFPGQIADARAYLASDEHKADLAAQAVAQSQTELNEVAANLARGTIPARAQFDLGAFIAAVFIYLTNSSAAIALWRAKPETPAEAKRRATAERVEKARLTREANRRVEKAQRPSWFRGVLQGKKSA